MAKMIGPRKIRAYGNTFKATAKPVLIGTAVVGATTMIFSLILVIKNTLDVEPAEILNLLNPYTIMGFLLGGAVIYCWHLRYFVYGQTLNEQPAWCR